MMCFGKQNIATLFQLIGTIIHAFLNYLFITVFHFEVIGLASATSLCNLLNLTVLTLYTFYDPKLRQTWIMPRVHMLHSIGAYIKLAIPSLTMLCLPWWGFEAQFYIASQVSLHAANVQVIMVNLCSLFY